MKYVSNVLFWISNGLLVPVIVGLLYFFVNSILLLGIFFNQYLTHSKQTKLWTRSEPTIWKNSRWRQASSLRVISQASYAI